MRNYGLLLLLILLTNPLFALDGMSVKDPFSLIDTAKKHAKTKLAEPVFLTIESYQHVSYDEGCNQESWKYIFTDRRYRKIEFVFAYERKGFDGQCLLQFDTELVLEGPKKGICEIEPILSDRHYSLEEALKIVKGEIPGATVIGMEIYRPLHPKFLDSIYGIFKLSREGRLDSVFFNFMTGAIH